MITYGGVSLLKFCYLKLILSFKSKNTQQKWYLWGSYEKSEDKLSFFLRMYTFLGGGVQTFCDLDAPCRVSKALPKNIVGDKVVYNGHFWGIFWHFLFGHSLSGFLNHPPNNTPNFFCRGPKNVL